MTDKELRKLSRTELLELLLEQSQEIDRLKNELDQAHKDLSERKLTIENCGSIAEASIAVSRIFEEAQKAAEQYLENVKRVVDEKAAKEENLPEVKVEKTSEEPAKPAEEKSNKKTAQHLADQAWEKTKILIDKVLWRLP